jgi:hypothetical protein
VLTTSVSSNNGINSHSLRVPLLVVLFFFNGLSEERIKTKTEYKNKNNILHLGVSSFELYILTQVVTGRVGARLGKPKEDFVFGTD